LLDKWIECYYGQSGSGKSESIVAVITRIYNDTGKKARILVGDGSGATYTGLVVAGVAEIIDYTTRDWPLSTLSQLCQGYWPADPLDPKSKMLPMTPEKFKTLGVCAIEGLSVGAEYVMGDKKGGFAARAALGEKIAGDSPIQLIDHERNAQGNIIANSGPGLAFGGVTLGGYGHAQRRMLGFIEQSKGLPGWVIWTAHERVSEDKNTMQKVMGPEVAGGALTTKLSRYFNNTLHFATAEKTIKVEDSHTGKKIDVIDAEYRIYTKDHFRAEGNTFVKYKAVTRTPDPQTMPTFFTSDDPHKSILDFYENIQAARARDIAKLTGPKEAA
jgi:hypothetical protein